MGGNRSPSLAWRQHFGDERRDDKEKGPCNRQQHGSQKPEGYATSNTQDLDRFYRLASLRAAVALIPPISLPTSAQVKPLARSSRACARRCSAVSLTVSK